MSDICNIILAKNLRMTQSIVRIDRRSHRLAGDEIGNGGEPKITDRRGEAAKKFFDDDICNYDPQAVVAVAKLANGGEQKLSHRRRR